MYACMYVCIFSHNVHEDTLYTDKKQCITWIAYAVARPYLFFSVTLYSVLIHVLCGIFVPKMVSLFVCPNIVPLYCSITLPFYV